MLLRMAPWIFVSLWSTGYIAMKFAAPFAEPFTFLAIRFALVVIILAPFILWSGHWLLSWRNALAAMLVGMLLHGIYLGGIFWAIKAGLPAGIAAIIISLQPILSASLIAPVLGEKVEWRHWAGLLLGLAGAMLVLSPQIDTGAASIGAATLAMSVLSLASITIGTTLQKSWFAGLDVRATLLPQYIGATAVAALIAFAFEDREVAWSWQAVGALLWLVLVLSVGAISLFLMLLRRNEVWRTVSLFYLIPPLTATTAWLLFDERLVPLQLAGMAIVVLAMVLARPPQAGAAASKPGN